MLQKDEKKLRRALTSVGVTKEKDQKKIVELVTQMIWENSDNALRGIVGNSR